MKNPTAYHRKTNHDIFLMTMEWLEKYIEVSYGEDYPNWQNRKQIHDNNIKRTDIDGNPEMAEDSLATSLLILFNNISSDPDFLLEELKEEFYKWIDAVGIKVDNCPKRLKCFLLGIHKTLEGDNKILKDIENSQRDCEPGSPEYAEQMNSLFSIMGENLPKIQKEEQKLEGKKWDEITIESKFPKGDTKLGKVVFEEIAKTITDYDKFYFRPQKGEPRKPKKVVLNDKSSISPSKLQNHENPQRMSGEKKAFFAITGIGIIILLVFICREIVKNQKSKKNHHE